MNGRAAAAEDQVARRERFQAANPLVRIRHLREPWVHWEGSWPDPGNLAGRPLQATHWELGGLLDLLEARFGAPA